MADQSPTARHLPSGVVEDIVGEPRRRAVLCHLAERDEPVALPDLAAAVAAEETETAEGDVSAAERRRICEELFQDHLPKLTATGVVEFDSLQGTLRLCDGVVRERVT